MTTHKGTLDLGEAATFDVIVHIEEEILSIRAGGATIGDWPMKYCRVSTTDESEFALWVDGERALFHPDDPRSFGLEAARSFQSSPLGERLGVLRSVVDPAERLGPVETVRTTPRFSDVSWFSDRRTPVVLIAGAIVSVVLVTVATVDFSSFGASASPEATTTTSSTTPETTVPEPPGVFGSTVEEFRSAWNAAARDLDVSDLVIPSFPAGTPTAVIGEIVFLACELDTAGRVSSLTLSFDPSGAPDADAFGLDAIGLAMAVSDPALTGPQRRQILASLGLDLGAPDLNAVGGQRQVGEVIFALRYVPEAPSLLFLAAPDVG